jgi:hypothetical protein
MSLRLGSALRTSATRELVGSRSLSGDGKKSSTILTRPISPLLYLTVGFFMDRRPSLDFARRCNLPVMPALVAGIYVFL